MTTESERSAAMLALAKDQARALEKIRRMREAAIQLALTEGEAQTQESTTVGGLLAALVSDTAQTAGLAADRARTAGPEAETARQTASKMRSRFNKADTNWSTWLKEAVGRRELLVRDVATLGPANNTPAVRQWTESSAADLPGYVAALVVLKADARHWLAGLGIPLPPSLQDAGGDVPRHPAPAPAGRIHSTKDRRAHWLDAVLKTAQAQATDSNSAMSVWHALCALAASESPPEPLIGISGNSIKRRDGASHKRFDYDAFSKYWNRRQTPGDAA